MGDLGSFPGLGKSPGRGHGNPLQYSCQENPHGQKSLAGYSPRGHKELDTTECPRSAHRAVKILKHCKVSQNSILLFRDYHCDANTPYFGQIFIVEN